MGILETSAILVSISALFSFLNYKFLKLPTSIGLMLIALLMSLVLIGLNALGIDAESWADSVLGSVEFDETLLQGMLSFLLFAGALHVNLDDLRSQKWVIGTLASVGVLVSTILIGGAMYLVLDWMGAPLPLLYCLLFGALISPTDPIAVLGILKQAKVPKSLETKIAGESLFNDGVGVVVFLVLSGIAFRGREPALGPILLLFAQEAIGGALLGLVLGYAVYHMLKQVNNYQVEVLLTLALVMGGYALARWLHVSGPIAMVVAGLLIGNHGRAFAMSDTTREHLDTFWELMDEILNTVLFVLIGLEVLVLTFSGEYLAAGLVAIPLVLLARLVTVGSIVGLLRLGRSFSPRVVRILTWGGLRGGISIALALSLPAGPERDLLVAVTYVVVVFSILVQGLTVGHLVAGQKS
ncbi:MAG: sodium:proton antiporter [Gammaproteobacteria bacterium]|nr:sodium:proton antiporter [Gammaproteobacteria bacterium]